MNDVNPDQNAHGAVFSTRIVGEITGLFRVLPYQRGYRWGENEVRQLLDDIWESTGTIYRLQPIVVRPTEDGAWELIDGQQRLTTLYLIYRFMTKSGLKNVPRFMRLTIRRDQAAPNSCGTPMCPKHRRTSTITSFMAPIARSRNGSARWATIGRNEPTLYSFR